MSSNLLLPLAVDEAAIDDTPLPRTNGAAMALPRDGLITLRLGGASIVIRTLVMERPPTTSVVDVSAPTATSVVPPGSGDHQNAIQWQVDDSSFALGYGKVVFTHKAAADVVNRPCHVAWLWVGGLTRDDAELAALKKTVREAAVSSTFAITGKWVGISSRRSMPRSERSSSTTKTGIFRLAIRSVTSRSILGASVQDEVTQRIVKALEVELTTATCEARLGLGAPRAKVNAEVCDLTMRARANHCKLTPAHAAEARRSLARAIEIDPRFGPAYAVSALVHCAEHANGWMTDEGHVNVGMQYARRAMELDPEDAQAHRAIAMLSMFRRDYALAERDDPRARQVPQSAGARARHREMPNARHSVSANHRVEPRRGASCHVDADGTSADDARSVTQRRAVTLWNTRLG